MTILNTLNTFICFKTNNNEWYHGNNFRKNRMKPTEWTKPKKSMHNSKKIGKKKNFKKKKERDLPITLWACWDPRRIAAKPKSPILTCPRWPFTKMLSHLRSLCITGGSSPCK